MSALHPSKSQSPALLLGVSIIASLLLPLAPAQPLSGARYLIIAPDSFVSALQPLADWKTQKGVLARIVPLSQAGTDPTQVRNYIRNAWQNWPVRPEYVLLACNPQFLSGYTRDNDCYYGNMTGDYRMEIAVGRFPADNAYDCRTIVAKTLAYERPAPDADTNWYLRGLTLVSEEDTFNPDPYYQADSRLARQLWLDAGYIRADSMFGVEGDSSAAVARALNDGRSFITYRGTAGGYWWFPFMIWPDPSWDNREKPPVIVGATCQTVQLSPGAPMFGNEAVRFGSPEELGGAVAYLGTSRSGMIISQFRSAWFRGFFDAVFNRGVRRIGPAAECGRLRMDSLFGDSIRYEEWAIVGDPELNLWTSRPKTAAVVCSAGTRVGPQVFPVSVHVGTQPVSGALVCLAMDSTVYAVETTDASGLARLNVAPTHPGLMSIVVTGPNLRPFQGRSVVFGTGWTSLVYLKHDVDDSPPGGNGDGILGPGETARLPVWLVNYGDSTARAVSGVLRTGDSLVRVLDSLQSYGTIAGQDSARTQGDGYELELADTCPDARELTFNLTCRDSIGEVQNTTFQVMVGAPVLTFDGCGVVDSAGNSNGRLDPCETADLSVLLRNQGHGPADQTFVTLRSLDSRVTVTDSLALFGTIPAGTRRSSDDRFTVTAGLMLPETEVRFELSIQAHNYHAVAEFSLVVGVLGQNDPLSDGPRTPPLYWAYDDVDSLYPEHPDFSWIELRGNGAHVTFHHDTTFVVDLPVAFGPLTYYGERFSKISVCSNGFIVPGVSSFTLRDNQRLPNNAIPPIIAVHWDAIAPILGNGIWFQYDSTGHRFVVEWDSVHYRSASNRFERFEVAFSDSTRPARDGNTEFVFQYLTANNVGSSTVGIQDPTRTIGIQDVYSGQYAHTAAHLVPGRAIKFTTDVPIEAVVEPDRLESVGLIRDELVVFPNPACDAVTIRYCPGPYGISPQLAVYDINGRLVRNLTLPRSLSPSLPASLSWNCRDQQGARLPAGVYYCRLVGEEARRALRLVILP